MFATRNKCIATSNKCLTSSNKKLVETIISIFSLLGLLGLLVLVRSAMFVLSTCFLHVLRPSRSVVAFLQTRLGMARQQWAEHFSTLFF